MSRNKNPGSSLEIFGTYNRARLFKWNNGSPNEWRGGDVRFCEHEWSFEDSDLMLIFESTKCKELPWLKRIQFYIG